MPGGLSPPPEVYLSWPKPNYVDPPSRGNAVVVLNFVLLALCFIVVGLRSYARLLQANTFGLDDVFVLVGMIPLTGFGVCILLGYTKYGFNHHIWDIHPSSLQSDRKLAIALQILFAVSTGMTKVAVLLFYRRLTSGTLSTRFHMAVYSALASVVLFTIAAIVSIVTSCIPLNAYWESVDPRYRSSHKYHCTNEAALIIASGFISTVQDLVACALPTILFWHLQISRKQKILLVGIFGLAYMLCICAIARVAFTIRLYSSTYDIPWETQPVWITTVLEAHLGVICASAPALNYFFRHALRNISSGSSRRSSRLASITPRSHTHHRVASRSDSTERVLDGTHSENKVRYVMDDLEFREV